MLVLLFVVVLVLHGFSVSSAKWMLTLVILDIVGHLCIGSLGFILVVSASIDLLDPNTSPLSHLSDLLLRSFERVGLLFF